MKWRAFMCGELGRTGGKWLWPASKYYPHIFLEVLGYVESCQDSLYYLVGLITSRLIKFIILKDLVAFIKNTLENLQEWCADSWWYL
jgi:hypothetical protein